MNKCTFPILTIVLMMLFSCGGGKDDPGDTTITMKAAESIRLSDYFDRISYIFLDENPASVFSRADHILCRGDRWYILDKTLKTVLCFDTNGVFRFRIQRVGRGPGEYSRLDGLWYSEKSNELFLHCQYPAKTMVYDTSGIFIREYRPERGAHDMTSLPNGGILGYSLYHDGSGKDSIPAGVFEMSEKGEFRRQLFDLGGMFLYWQVTYSRHWCPIDDRYYLLSQSDSIVMVNTQGKGLIDCVLDWGKYQMPYSVRSIPSNAPRSNEIFTSDRVVWKDHLLVAGPLRLFHCAIGNDYYYALIDKSTKTGLFTQGIENDLTSLPAPYPIAQNEQGELVGMLDLDLIWAIKEALTKQQVPHGKEEEIQELHQFIEKAISLDRPVMVRYRLRNHWNN